MTGATGIVDTLVNCFLPDRQAVWDGSIAAAGIAVKVRRDPTDSFCDADEMVALLTMEGHQDAAHDTVLQQDSGRLESVLSAQILDHDRFAGM